MPKCSDCKTEMVRAFHQKFGCTYDTHIDDPDLADLRVRLIDEELDELARGLDNNNRIEVADALGDLLYVIYGAADLWGIDIDRVFAEIHRSNMTKDGGGKRDDGKILKGPNYSPPDLSFVNEGFVP